MNRPSRGGKTQAKQTGHSNILGGAAGATGIAGNGIAGISGGQYSPAGIGSGPNEDGSAGVSVPASVSKVTVNHPILDAIFNRGQGSQFANQANLGIAMQQLTGQQGLDKTALENKGRLENTGLEGKNTLANTKQVGQNALETLIEGAKQGRLTNQQVHDLAVLGHAGLTSDALAEYNGVVQPQKVENLTKDAKGEGLLGDIKNNYLGTPKGRANAETGIGAELTSPAAKNIALTKVNVGPNEMSNATPIPGPAAITGIGAVPGGTLSTSTVDRDANNPLKVITTNRETRIPGTPPYMRPPPVVDTEEDRTNFLKSQAPPTVNPALQGSPAPSINQLGISPTDPTMPSGISSMQGILQMPQNPFSLYQNNSSTIPQTGIQQGSPDNAEIVRQRIAAFLGSIGR